MYYFSMMIHSKATNLIIHLAGWVLFMMFPLLFMNGLRDNTSIASILASVPYWQFILCYVSIFYLHTYFIFPKVFLKKKYVVYGCIVVVGFVVVYILQPFDGLMSHNPNGGPPHRNRAPSHIEEPSDRNNFPPPEFRPRPRYEPFDSLAAQRNSPPESRGRPGRRPPIVDITSLFIFIMIMAMSIATGTLQQWRLTEKRMVQAEADKANAELSFLKAQINPHFLFNTLNNIYALALTNNQNTATAIMKLSNIMRYVTEDVTEDFVTLQSEIGCILDYIDLQKLRLSKNTNLEIEIKGETENKSIAPLILMTFVENVFKYGVSNKEPASIIIKLQAEQEKIRFFSQNRIFNVPNNTERTGIGLSNTRKRLAHLYPNTHELTITTDEKIFTVELVLKS
jgi:two-component system, LytTR family, sensor kinase